MVAVARREPLDPQQALTGAHNAISLERAIRAACLDPALSAGLQDVGRLVPGHRADLLIVPSEPFTTAFDAAKVALVRPLATYIDGELVRKATPSGEHGDAQSSLVSRIKGPFQRLTAR